MERVTLNQDSSYGYLGYILNCSSFQKESAGKKKYLPNDKIYREILDYLNNISINEDRPKKMTKKAVLDTTKDFFDDHFKLHDILFSYKKELYSGNPFEIPVTGVDGVDMGSLRFDFSFLTTFAFDKIVLSKNYDYNSIGVYSHELVHSQLENEFGKYYTNYFNKEVISIFLEKIAVFETDPKYLDYILNMRLGMLKNVLNLYKEEIWNIKYPSKDLFDARSYIESTLIANHLFYKYMNSDRAHQIKILCDIQKVFNNDITVEDLISIERVGMSSSKSLKYVK